MNSTMGYQAPKPVIMSNPNPSSGYRQDDDPFAGLGSVPSSNRSSGFPSSQQHYNNNPQQQTPPMQTQFSSPDNGMYNGLQYTSPQAAATAQPYPHHQPQQQQQQQQQSPFGQSPSSMYQPQQQLHQQAHPTTSTTENGMFLGLQPSSTGQSSSLSTTVPSVPPSSNYGTSTEGGGLENGTFPSSSPSYNSSSFGMSTTSPEMQMKLQNYQQSMPSDPSSSSSQPPPINGMFLGLEPPKENNNDDDGEDRELRRAREAALYAEGLLKEEAAKKANGPLGFGILPKAKNIFHGGNGSNAYNSPVTNVNPNPPSSEPRADFHVDDVYDDDGNREDDRPAWFSSENRKSQSDYGINGAVVVSNDQNQQQVEPTKGAAIAGASVVGAVAGLALMGPIAGIVAAGGAAFAAGTKDGVVGDAFRGTGKLVAKAGSAAKNFENQTGIGKKTASGIAKGAGWIAKQTIAKNP